MFPTQIHKIFAKLIKISKIKVLFLNKSTQTSQYDQFYTRRVQDIAITSHKTNYIYAPTTATRIELMTEAT